MLKLFSFIPIIGRIIRIRDIREFDESDYSLSDIQTFARLIKRYKLSDGIVDDEILAIHLDVHFNHISDFLSHLDLNVKSIEKGRGATEYRYVKTTHCSLKDWLSSDKGHYAVKPAMNCIVEELSAYDEALHERYSNHAPETVQRVLTPTSSTLRGIIRALAEYHFDMDFEEV